MRGKAVVAAFFAIALAGCGENGTRDRAAREYLRLAGKTNAEQRAVDNRRAEIVEKGGFQAYYAEEARVEHEFVSGLRAISVPGEAEGDKGELARVNGEIESVDVALSKTADKQMAGPMESRLKALVAKQASVAAKFRKDLGLPPPPAPTGAPR